MLNGRLAMGCLITLLLLCTPIARGQSFVKEADLLGVWHVTGADAAVTQVTFFADHHYLISITGLMTGTMTGPWHVRNGWLVTKWSGGKLTLLGHTKRPNGRFQREKLIKIEGDALTTQQAGESQPNVYKRGPTPNT